MRILLFNTKSRCCCDILCVNGTVCIVLMVWCVCVQVTETRTGPLGCSTYDNLDSVSSVLLQSPESKLHLQGTWHHLQTTSRAATSLHFTPKIKTPQAERERFFYNVLQNIFFMTCRFFKNDVKIYSSWERMIYNPPKKQSSVVLFNSDLTTREGSDLHRLLKVLKGVRNTKRVIIVLLMKQRVWRWIDHESRCVSVCHITQNVLLTKVLKVSVFPYENHH